MADDRYVAHAWVERDDRLLVLRRLPGRYLGGSWDIPGGTVEPGETPSEAAIRETAEEAGLTVLLGPELSHHVNEDTAGRPLLFHTLTYRVREANPQRRDPVRLCRAEHDRYAWVTPAEALELKLVWHVRATIAGVAARR